MRHLIIQDWIIEMSPVYRNLETLWNSLSTHKIEDFLKKELIASDQSVISLKESKIILHLDEIMFRDISKISIWIIERLTKFHYLVELNFTLFHLKIASFIISFMDRILWAIHTIITRLLMTTTAKAKFQVISL